MTNTKLMTAHDIAAIRGGARLAYGPDQYAKRVAATGRAACRCCGQKIAKGETALSFAALFTDATNAYHVPLLWLHLDCEAPEGQPRTRVEW